MNRIFVTSLLATAVVLPPAGASAGARKLCSEHGKVIGQFAEVYKENRVAGGLTRDGRLVEVLSTDDGRTWTIVVSRPNGETCVMMAGEGWRKLKVKKVDLGPRT
jgi:hypothetical protein